MRFIRLNEDKQIISVRFGSTIVDGEIESELGEIGQILQPDGTFSTPEAEPVEPAETLEEKIDRLEKQVQEDNLMQFEVLATIYEELLMKG